MHNPFLIIFLVLFWGLPAHATDIKLTQTQGGIHLKVQNQPLSKVLQTIGQKSGIAFYMRQELYETPMTADLIASDWESLASELLKDFSKVEMWAEDTVGSKIRITGLGEYVPQTAGTAPKEPTIITVPKTESSRFTSIPNREEFNRPEPPKKAKELHPDHPLAKLPSHVFMEPAIMNYLLEKNVDIPDAFKQKYGLPITEEEEAMALHTQRRSLPIPNEIYNDPAFDEYLKAVGLAKPPQIPPGFKKLKPGERP